MYVRQSMFAAAPFAAISTIVHLAVATPARLIAQGASAPPNSAFPRTPDGHPDLTGTWDYATTTPMERMKKYVGKPFTDEEKQAISKAGADRADAFVLTSGGGVGSYNHEWYGWGDPIDRPSLIVDPPDRQFPPPAPGARAGRPQGLPAGPEDFTTGDRCIVMNVPPFRPSAYNNNVGLVLSRTYLSIQNEMIHSTRIVPLDGRPHMDIPQWLGDSRGRWDGDTLVVDTVSFRGDPSRASGGRGKRVTERFRRVDAATIEYTATVDDPATWVAPWTMTMPLRKTALPMYEYACHEGNYAMPNMLGIARAEELKKQRSSR